jgi:hypothetical protein
VNNSIVLPLLIEIQIRMNSNESSKGNPKRQNTKTESQINAKGKYQFGKMLRAEARMK